MQEDYSLTMSITDNKVTVTLYTPSHGMSQGSGTTPEAAIISLSGNIEGAQMLKRALDQPMARCPMLIPETVHETLANVSPCDNVGKIVHYMPGSDDTEQPGQVLAAIITREWGGGKMDLQVFSNKVSGTHSRYSVEHSQNGSAGTWAWPKK
jgi:hypothetical protein